MQSGVSSAALLLAAWLISLISLLRLDLAHWPFWVFPLVVGLRTALQTGLFITAHDAMHGHLLPGHIALNHRIGAFFLWLYAGLPYRRCWRQHYRHHRRPGSRFDPDSCGDQAMGALGWYICFMAGYLSLGQMLRLLVFWFTLALMFCHAQPQVWLNMVVICILPLWLSSLQLFVVGTFLPHRWQQGSAGLVGPQTLDWPGWLSLLACFHFGYHREHHDKPELAWFQLPAEHRRRNSLALSRAREYRLTQQ